MEYFWLNKASLLKKTQKNLLGFIAKQYMKTNHTKVQTYYNVRQG